MQVILLSVLRQSVLLQLRLHSRLNTWFQLISHRQLEGETGNIQVERVGAPHISDWTVVTSHQQDLLTIIEDNPIQLPISRPWWGYSHLFKDMSRLNYRNGINKFYSLIQVEAYIFQSLGPLMAYVMIIEDNPNSIANLMAVVMIELSQGHKQVFIHWSRVNIYLSVIWAIDGLGNDHWGQTNSIANLKAAVRIFVLV